MNRPTTLAATAAALAAVALAAAATPASAEAVVYKNKTVSSHQPGTPEKSTEYASLDVPTGYARSRMDWHTVLFAEQVPNGRAIIVDLHPDADTVEELTDERDAFAEAAGDSYHEYAFKVNDEDSAVSARWTFSYEEPGSEGTPYVTVVLMGGNRVQVAGDAGAAGGRKAVDRIRKHVVRSVVFPG